MLITGHHEGFIDWDAYQRNQQRLAGNIRPQHHQPGTGAVREGCALCQGLATCGTCGRKLAVYYDGPAKSTPGYYCTSGDIVNGRGVRHLRAGGTAIDAAVTGAFLAALQPAALQACLAAAQQLEEGHDTVLDQHRRQVEQARYTATRAERRYRSVDPENRLVARGLETEWNTALADVADAEAQLGRREQTPPRRPSPPPSVTPSPPSATTSARSGTRPPPPTRTASSCCAPCWTRSPSPCTATTPTAAPSCCCAGKAARSPSSPSRSGASPRRSAPARTPSTCCDVSPSATPTPRSPGSSTGSTAPPHGDCRSPPVESPHCAPTGTSPATSLAATHLPRETCST